MQVYKVYGDLLKNIHHSPPHLPSLSRRYARGVLKDLNGWPVVQGVW